MIDISTRRPLAAKPPASVAALLAAYLLEVGSQPDGAIAFFSPGNLLRAVEQALEVARIEPYILEWEDDR